MPSQAEESPAQARATTPLITPEVIEQYSPALLSHARRLLSRREDAEDAVQETWISALHSAPSYEGRASLRSWLTAILRRRVVDRYRRRMFVPFASEPAADAELDAHDLHEATARAKHALAELHELERRAIVLCDLDGWDRAEAAADMRVTRGHLRELLHRARNKLERALRAEGIGAEILC